MTASYTLEEAQAILDASENYIGFHENTVVLDDRWTLPQLEALLIVAREYLK